MSSSRAPRTVWGPIGGAPLTPLVAPFQGGVWKLHVELPDQYPYKSPSIGFRNRIFHPNIDEAYPVLAAAGPHRLCRSGSVCLDVINQSWSSMFSTARGGRQT